MDQRITASPTELMRQAAPTVFWEYYMRLKRTFDEAGEPTPSQTTLAIMAHACAVDFGVAILAQKLEAIDDSITDLAAAFRKEA